MEDLPNQLIYQLNCLDKNNLNSKGTYFRYVPENVLHMIKEYLINQLPIGYIYSNQRKHMFIKEKSISQCLGLKNNMIAVNHGNCIVLYRYMNDKFISRIIDYPDKSTEIMDWCLINDNILTVDVESKCIMLFKIANDLNDGIELLSSYDCKNLFCIRDYYPYPKRIEPFNNKYVALEFEMTNSFIMIEIESNKIINCYWLDREDRLYLGSIDVVNQHYSNEYSMVINNTNDKMRDIVEILTPPFNDPPMYISNEEYKNYCFDEDSFILKNGFILLDYSSEGYYKLLKRRHLDPKKDGSDNYYLASRIKSIISIYECRLDILKDNRLLISINYGSVFFILNPLRNGYYHYVSNFWICDSNNKKHKTRSELNYVFDNKRMISVDGDENIFWVWEPIYY